MIAIYRTEWQSTILTVFVSAAPLNELPVLTKQGVGCSLRDYMEGRHHGRTEHHDAVASSSPVQSTSADLPPPYVERIENDPVAIKASPASSDREGAAKENQSSKQD
jgi:hypothetical protein